MLFSCFININNDSLKKVNKINKRRYKINAVTLGFINNYECLEKELPNIIEFNNNHGILTLSIGGITEPFIQDRMDENEVFEFLSYLIRTTKCYGLDFMIDDSELLEEHNINKINKCIYKIVQEYKVHISYTIMVGIKPSITKNAMYLIKNIIDNNIKHYTINGILSNLYNTTITTIDWTNIIMNMKDELLCAYPKKKQSSIYKMLGVCLDVRLQDDNYRFNIKDTKDVIEYAVNNNLNCVSYLNLEKEIEENKFEIYDTIYNIVHIPFNWESLAHGFPKNKSDESYSYNQLNEWNKWNESNESNELYNYYSYYYNTVNQMNYGLSKNNGYGQEKKEIIKSLNNYTESYDSIDTKRQFQIIEWKSGVEYNTNDIIKYKSQSYKCIVPHISMLSWSPDKIKKNKSFGLWEICC